ncbi:FAD-dependent oxidoreductase [Nocardioides sp. B-3]|uniref:FAD-dependent oxidoreductase n=1 Tax=Nocardioides sp. B-3 TaxID=2895565 RepID=UPI002152AD27|nr:FAD-dependent oxidoreductase [Nocardioides sp. B-3]
MTIARTAANNGAQIATRCKVTGFLRDGERVVSATALDPENDVEFEVRAKVVINAAGVWTDEVQGADRRRRDPRRRRQQGRPPGRPEGPDPLRLRLHHQDREVGALRHPVGRLLDHRHHRHSTGTSISRTRRPARPTSTTSCATSTRCSRTRSTTATSSASMPACARCSSRSSSAPRATSARRPSSRASTPSPTRSRASC